MSYIECALQGLLGAPPVDRQTQAGKPFVTLSVIVQEKGTEHGEWVSVSVFEPLASALPEDMVKGERVYIEGRLRLRHWEDKEGKPRVGLQVTATELLALDRIGRRRRATGRQSRASGDDDASNRDYAQPLDQERAA